MKKGIDISYWQGEIDFAKVKADGIEFLILRDGYSNSMDKRFLEYATKSKAVGIPIKGIYHFSYATNVTEAINEANKAVEFANKAGLGKNTVIFYDFEYDTVEKAKSKGIVLGKNECISFTKAFCTTVTKAGFKAGIYSNIDYYKNMYNPEILNSFTYWLADYSGEADYPCEYRQYSSTGKVNGINGNVDMDYCYLDEKTKKSNTEIAKEVIAGKWGNNPQRKEKLIAEGYDYDIIQKTVNEMLRVSSAFNVKVEIANLNIRKGPGINYDKTGKHTGIGVFTIIEVKNGTGSKSGWGKLKSGAGWISLDYAKKI